MPEIKLHIGCGDKYIPGYWHIDTTDYEHVDYITSMDDLYMFEDETVDVIYCCHALEYLDRLEVLYALLEWNRVLKSDGMLRIAVPDFEAMVKAYLKYHDLETVGVLSMLFGRIKSDDGYIYHKTTYDYDSLEQLLIDMGYKDIHRYDWRDTEHANVDDYSQAYVPHMDKENGMLMSLNVECKK